MNAGSAANKNETRQAVSLETWQSPCSALSAVVSRTSLTVASVNCKHLKAYFPAWTLLCAIQIFFTLVRNERRKKLS